MKRGEAGWRAIVAPNAMRRPLAWLVLSGALATSGCFSIPSEIRREFDPPAVAPRGGARVPTPGDAADRSPSGGAPAPQLRVAADARP